MKKLGIFLTTFAGLFIAIPLLNINSQVNNNNLNYHHQKNNENVENVDVYTIDDFMTAARNNNDMSIMNNIDFSSIAFNDTIDYYSGTINGNNWTLKNRNGINKDKTNFRYFFNDLNNANINSLILDDFDFFANKVENKSEINNINIKNLIVEDLDYSSNNLDYFSLFVNEIDFSTIKSVILQNGTFRNNKIIVNDLTETIKDGYFSIMFAKGREATLQNVGILNLAYDNNEITTNFNQHISFLGGDFVGKSMLVKNIIKGSFVNGVYFKKNTFTNNAENISKIEVSGFVSKLLLTNNESTDNYSSNIYMNNNNFNSNDVSKIEISAFSNLLFGKNSIIKNTVVEEIDSKRNHSLKLGSKDSPINTLINNFSSEKESYKHIENVWSITKSENKPNAELNVETLNNLTPDFWQNKVSFNPNSWRNDTLFTKDLEEDSIGYPLFNNLSFIKTNIKESTENNIIINVQLDSQWSTPITIHSIFPNYEKITITETTEFDTKIPYEYTLSKETLNKWFWFDLNGLETNDLYAVTSGLVNNFQEQQYQIPSINITNEINGLTRNNFKTIKYDYNIVDNSNLIVTKDLILPSITIETFDDEIIKTINKDNLSFVFPKYVSDPNNWFQQILSNDTFKYFNGKETVENEYQLKGVLTNVEEITLDKPNAIIKNEKIDNGLKFTIDYQSKMKNLNIKSLSNDDYIIIHSYFKEFDIDGDGTPDSFDKKINIKEFDLNLEYTITGLEFDKEAMFFQEGTLQETFNEFYSIETSINYSFYNDINFNIENGSINAMESDSFLTNSSGVESYDETKTINDELNISYNKENNSIDYQINNINDFPYINKYNISIDLMNSLGTVGNIKLDNNKNSGSIKIKDDSIKEVFVNPSYNASDYFYLKINTPESVYSYIDVNKQTILKPIDTLIPSEQVGYKLGISNDSIINKTNAEDIMDYPITPLEPGNSSVWIIIGPVMLFLFILLTVLLITLYYMDKEKKENKKEYIS